MPASSPRRIAKGRIARIDASEALRVAGVIDVLTHENRPPHGEHRQRLQGRRGAGGGSPFRPLYDDKIMFNGQPIALVVAEESEIARFAASLVRVEYEEEAHVTDLHRQRDGRAFSSLQSRRRARSAPRSRAARPSRRSPQPRCATRAEYYVPIEHHNPMELYASTVDLGRRTASSRSTTRPRACRTCSAISAACSR